MFHRCDRWTRLGINCPGGLLQEVPTFGGRQRREDPRDAYGPMRRKMDHRKSKRGIPRHIFQSEWHVLQAAWREANKGKVPFRGYDDAIREEAYGQGARGRELALWIAAGAASGAVALRYGPASVEVLPRLVERALRAGGVGRTQGRGGFRVNAAREMRRLLQGGGLRSVSAPGWTDAGGDFF